MFSDPGGAKPVLALVSSIRSKLDSYKIVSDRTYSFFDDFGLSVEASTSDIDEFFRAYTPDFLFTGTSYTSKIELEYIATAKRIGVLSYAFVDHWTSIRERFMMNDEEVLPDYICVVDSKAKQIGVLQGLNENVFCIIGNPFHEYLKAWAPSLSRIDFFEKLGLHIGNKRILVFAPDPLSNVNGSKRFGFDEISVIEEIDNMLDDISKFYQIIFKPHPNQDISKLSNSFLNRVYVADQSIDNNSLVYYSDIIIGFFSNYLIEATIMGKEVFRYLPINYTDDPFKDLGIGKIINRETILKFLNN